MSGAATLSQMLRRSAASTGSRAGHTVPLHFGSAAGELALCMQAVGLVHREDLAVVAVRGDEPALDEFMAGRLGAILAVGEAATCGGIHWGRSRVDELLAVGLPEVLLSLGVPPGSAGGLRSEALDLTAIGLVGPSTMGLLLDVGACGSLPPASPGNGRTASIAGDAGTWLLLDDAFALALVEPARAVELWQLLTAAGSRFSLGYVGAEAAERFELTRCTPTALPQRALH